MTIIQSVILGIVEGITEFLPISSTFHLIFTSKILGLPQNEFIKLFEVFIQSGAILSVALLFLQELLRNRSLIIKIGVSFIPTGIIGFLLYKIIKDTFFESDFLMVGMFMGIGIVFLFLEWMIARGKVSLKKGISSLSYKEALLVGLAQALAIIPGVSRAGSVMVGMMLMRYKRDEAAKYSFMLAIPTIFMASAYDLYKMKNVLPLYSDAIPLLLTGSLVAFITAYIVVKWLITYLKTNTLVLFGYYRILLAIIILLALTR